MGSQERPRGLGAWEGSLVLLGALTLILGLVALLSGMLALGSAIAAIGAATLTVAVLSLKNAGVKEPPSSPVVDFLGAAGIGRWEWKVAGNTTTSSPALCDLLGLTGDSASLDQLAATVNREQRGALIEAVRSCSKGGRPFDLTFQTEPGRWVRGRGWSVGESDDRRVFALFEDVSQAKSAETNLAFVESRYFSMADNIPGVVYQMLRHADGTREVPYINAAVEDIFGVTREQVYADADILIRAIHPDERVEKEREAGRSMEELCQFDWSGRIVRPDGEVRWIHALCMPMRLAKGEYLWDGVILDVTQEKTAELEHVQTKERLAWLLKSSPVVIYSCSSEPPYPLTYLSDNAEDLLGVDLDEYRSDSLYWQKRVHPDDAQDNIDVLDEIAHSQRRTIEYRFRASRNEYRWVRDEMRYVTHNGRSEIVGTIVDVTERRLAQQALRESEERFRAMTGASPVGVFVMAKEGSLVYANSKLAEILRIDQPELLGDKIYTLLHPEDAERAKHRIQEALDHDNEASVQCRFLREDFTTIWCGIKTAPLPGAGAVGTIEDVTDRHELELESEQARIAAERANQAKSAFLSRLSHELRTPLHAVLGFAQLLQVTDLDPNQSESVDQVIGGGKHLLSLINDVLDIARAESGELHVESAPVEVAPVVHEAVKLLSLQARDKNVLVDIKIKDDDSTTVFADRKRLLQVVINVLSNAIKYNKREGAIIVSMEKSDRKVTLVVRDTGTGIPQEKVNRLFTPFDRLGAEATEIEGSGLGLILSKRLAEAMKGSIRIESDVRTGTVARLTLPEAGAPAEYAAVTLPSPPQRIESEPRHVLLIEDIESSVRLFESVFEARPQYTLKVQRNGTSGLKAALDDRPGLILLDANLPDVVGTDLIERIRKEPELRNTPVIVVSAAAEKRAQDRFLQAGADAYLTKPLDLRILQSTIDAVLSGVKP